MKYKIVELNFTDGSNTIITQRYVKTKQGYIHLPIKIGEITKLKKIEKEKPIGEIDLDLPSEHIIIEKKEIKYNELR